MTANQRSINAVSTIYAMPSVITSSFPTTLILAKIERPPNRNPNFFQFSELPLYKERLQILPKLLKIESRTKERGFFFMSSAVSSAFYVKVTLSFGILFAFRGKNGNLGCRGGSSIRQSLIKLPSRTEVYSVFLLISRYLLITSTDSCRGVVSKPRIPCWFSAITIIRFSWANFSAITC